MPDALSLTGLAIAVRLQEGSSITDLASNAHSSASDFVASLLRWRQEEDSRGGESQKSH